MIDAEHIRQLCRGKGTTLTAVARKMYPSAKQPLSQLSTALRGNPRLDWVERLAKEIGCDTGDLFLNTDPLPDVLVVNGTIYDKRK